MAESCFHMFQVIVNARNLTFGLNRMPDQTVCKKHLCILLSFDRVKRLLSLLWRWVLRAVRACKQSLPAVPQVLVRFAKASAPLLTIMFPLQTQITNFI